jgi:hypothetical protein
MGYVRIRNDAQRVRLRAPNKTDVNRACGIPDQLSCHLRNYAMPTKSSAVGLLAALQVLE